MIRLELEEREKKTMGPLAQRSTNTKGREKKEDESDYMTSFQLDRERIIYSKAFRRLKHKTQVFLAPEGDHYRTRLTHTIEVSQIARTIARCLNLNEDLTEAIALGHDLGHTPFGHAGEGALNEVCPLGFKHYEQSLRVVDLLEGEGGLNLTWEVRDGILNHTGNDMAQTLEGQIIKYADRTAYINHDIEDAIRGDIIKEEDLPKDSLKILGNNTKDRIKNTILDIVENSKDKHKIQMSDHFQQAMDVLRTYMFKNVYHQSLAKRDEDKARNVVKELYFYFIQNPRVFYIESGMEYKEESLERLVCDFIAGMTDRYAVKKFHEIFVPKSWY